MKVAVRNLGGARHGGNRYRSAEAQAAAWRTLTDTGADVLLVQEAVAAAPVPDGWRAQPATTSVSDWGSVVAIAAHLSCDLDWRPQHRRLDAFNNYLDFATVSVADEEIAFVSVHAPTAWHEQTWNALGENTTMPTDRHRPWPSDIILDALHDAVPHALAVFAGDWNEAPNWPSANDGDTAEWFDRARRHGLTEVVAATFGGAVRTNFTKPKGRLYQNDHVFVTAALVDRVRSVSVWNEPNATISDHAGIVVTID